MERGGTESWVNMELAEDKSKEALAAQHLNGRLGTGKEKVKQLSYYILVALLLRRHDPTTSLWKIPKKEEGAIAK